MIEITIPGHSRLNLNHLVLDFNGTMACDGKLIEGMKEVLESLCKKIDIHVLTADTFGSVVSELNGLDIKLSIILPDKQDEGKLKYLQELGSGGTVCVGNGRNDRLMLKYSTLGILVIQDEGASVDSLLFADIVCKDILSALELLTHTERLVATLRN